MPKFMTQAEEQYYKDKLVLEEKVKKLYEEFSKNPDKLLSVTVTSSMDQIFGVDLIKK